MVRFLDKFKVRVEIQLRFEVRIQVDIRFGVRVK